MVKNSLTSFSPAVKMITKDKINLLFASIPVILGALLYIYAGKWIYTEFTIEGKKLIESHISEGAMGSFVYWIVSIVLTVVLYFAISFTFVLIVSLIASPFNDLLSARIERKIKGNDNFSVSESLSFISGKFLSVITNEIKKITFILVLSVLAFLISYIPIFTPISILINALLLAVGFVDYTWSRKDLAFGACFKDLRNNFVGYALAGGFFFILVSIPLINLVVPPLATSYFTVYWIKNNEYSN